MTYTAPDLDKRMDAIREWATWAAGCKVVWIDQSDRDRIREPREYWGELRPRRISTLGTDEIVHVDLEPTADPGDLPLEHPRQDVVYSLKVIEFDLRFKARDQRHLRSAWYAAVKAQTRIKNPYALEKWFKPLCWGVAEVGDVLNMGEIMIHDDRIEGSAIFTFNMSTTISDTDAAAVGTWIEKVEISSKDEQGNPGLIQADGVTPLDPSLQFDKEVIG
jgi:hypothetical protein